MVHIPTAVINKIAAELDANRDDANPFVKDDGKMFLRYDKLCTIQRCDGIVDVEFWWRGMLVYTMHIACDFSTGQQLELVGIEGMTQFSLSSF
jgi:hypothetical protein